VLSGRKVRGGDRNGLEGALGEAGIADLAPLGGGKEKKKTANRRGAGLRMTGTTRGTLDELGIPMRCGRRTDPGNLYRGTTWAVGGWGGFSGGRTWDGRGIGQTGQPSQERSRCTVAGTQCGDQLRRKRTQHNAIVKGVVNRRDQWSPGEGGRNTSGGGLTRAEWLGKKQWKPETSFTV